MLVRCLHCHEPIELPDDSDLRKVSCSSCGGSFSLVGDDTLSWSGQTTKRLGPFELIEQVGGGAFGTVWKARDPVLDRTVAIKVPRKGQLDEKETEQFLREARHAARLRHPNIVAVHEVGRDGDTVYIVSDFVQGVTLDDWLTGRSLSPREAAKLCIEIAEALHHAHEARVIHRDLKPGNVMLDLNGHPHLMDFGLSRREVGEVTMTVDGQVMGTPAYMSPEQAGGKAHEADRRSDVYSLGGILFRLLTGELPYRGSAQMVIVQKQREDAPSMRRLNIRIPRDIETICLKCLEREPRKRYTTAWELADELRRWLAAEPIRARPITKAARGWRWCKRNRSVAVLIAAVAATLLSGITVSIYFGAESKKEASRAQVLAESLSQALYAADMNNAMTAWERNDLLHMEKLLAKYANSPLRHWEWYHLRGLHDAAKAFPFTTPRDNPLRLHTFPDGKRTVVTFSRGATLSVIDANGSEAFSTGQMREGTFSLTYAAVSPDGALLAHPSTSFSSIIVRDTKSFNVQQEISIPSGTSPASVDISAATFSPDGRCLAIAGVNWGVGLFDLRSRTFEREIEIPSLTKYEVLAYSSNGKYLAVSSEPITVYDISNGSMVRELAGHTQEITDIRFLADDTWLVTSSRDRTIIVWDTKDWHQIRRLGAFDEEVRALAYHPRTKKLAAGLRSRRIKIWSLPDFAELEEIRDFNGLYALDFHDDGRIIYGSLARDIVIRGPETLTADSSRISCGGSVINLAFSTCGHYLACVVAPVPKSDLAENKRVLRLFSIGGGVQEVTNVPQVPFDISTIAASGGHGTNLLAVAARESMRVLMLDLAQLRVAFDAKADDTIGISAICFGLNSETALCGLEDGRLAELSVCNRGKSARFFRDRHKARVTEIAVLEDGRFVTGAGDGSVYVWRNGRVVEDGLGVDGGWIKGLAADGTKFAFGLFGGGTKEGDQIVLFGSDGRRTEIQGHTFSIQSLQFIEDGKTLVSMGADKQIKLWNCEPFEQRLAISGLEIFNTFAVSPDESTIAAGTREGTVFLYRR